MELRALGSDDEPLLRELVWLAVHWAETAPPRRPRQLPPEVEVYVMDFGGSGDRGLAAHSGPSAVGACWVRERPSGYGYVSADAGELSIAVFPRWRGRGIGRQLLAEVLAREVGPISLSVHPDNPALRLYQEFGFRRVGASGGAWTMLRHPETPA